MTEVAKVMVALARLAEIDKGLSILETEGVITLDQRIKFMRGYVEKHPEINEALKKVA